MSGKSRHSRILLLTGVPGVGKTTTVREAVRALSDLRTSGFTTEEIREGGRRKGFRLETLDGESATLAHVDITSRCNVGRYGVDVGTMDRVAVRTLRSDASVDLFVIDEIGKMECFSSRFVTAVGTLLDSNATVVATVPLKGSEFVRRIKGHSQAELWEITRENRDTMAGRVVEWVRLR
jgi:nucleoside-triphosphatase